MWMWTYVDMNVRIFIIVELNLFNVITDEGQLKSSWAEVKKSVDCYKNDFIFLQNLPQLEHTSSNASILILSSTEGEFLEDL